MDSNNGRRSRTKISQEFEGRASPIFSLSELLTLPFRLLELKRSYQQKITEYNHYVEAERNILITLRNKGVDIQHLVKGSSEPLPLSSTSTDVLFPFRKHSKSFNR